MQVWKIFLVMRRMRLLSNIRKGEIKSEDKKAFKSFVIVIVISSIIGGIFGFMSGYLKEIFGGSITNLLINILKMIAPFASLVFSILVIVAYKIIYTNSRKKYELWKQTNEDDDTIDKIEEKLSYILLLASINMIVGFFFFGVGTILLPFDNINGDLSIIRAICLLIGFLICIASSILIQNKIVNLEKEINPFLKGSVYDTKFTEKWVDSCDEAIKLSIYKSAYKAFSCVSTTCIILWMFCVLGSYLWDFGILPLTMVTIIWLVQTVSYCIESIKCSKSK